MTGKLSLNVSPVYDRRNMIGYVYDKGKTGLRSVGSWSEGDEEIKMDHFKENSGSLKLG